MEGLKKEKRMAKERKLAEIFQSPLFVLWDIDDALKQIRKRYEIDLALDNIKFFKNNIENLLEVSIGHALIVESLELGIETVIKKYLTYLK